MKSRPNFSSISACHCWASWGREDKHCVVGTAVVHFLENHPNLDGLAEADLVSEQCLTVNLEECAVGGIHLVFEEFDALLFEG